MLTRIQVDLTPDEVKALCSKHAREEGEIDFQNYKDETAITSDGGAQIIFVPPGDQKDGSKS